MFNLLNQVKGWDFPEICKELKIGLTGASRKSRPLKAPQTEAKWEATAWPIPSEKWRGQATKLAARAHECLLEQPAALKYLAGRGLPMEAVLQYGLGYIAGDDKTGTCLYRPRAAFDLPEEEDGKVKKVLWIPRGLTIPLWSTRSDGEKEVHRVRIRRRGEDIKKGGAKYLLLKGSGQAPMILPPTARPADRVPWVIVEAELDAMTLHYACAGLVGVIAVLTNLCKPDKEAHQYLQACPTVLVALDFDQADEKGRRPGRDGSRWWEKNYRNSRRWPVPEGKDPGEAFARGVDLLKWVNDALTRPLSAPAAQPCGSAGQISTGPPVGEYGEEATTCAAAVDETGRVCQWELGDFEYLFWEYPGGIGFHIVCGDDMSILEECLQCPGRPKGLDKAVREEKKKYANRQ